MLVSSRRTESGRKNHVCFGRSLRLGVSVASLIASGFAATPAQALTFDLAGVPATFAGLVGSDTYLNTGVLTDLTIDFSGSALFTGTISGAFGDIHVIKTGTGNQNLFSANSYGGGTDLQAGTLGFGNNLSFGSGTVTVSGASVLTPTASGVTLANTFNFQVNATVDTAGIVTTFAGPVNGVGGLTKIGNGVLQLANVSNGYSGGTALEQGGIRVGGNGSLGTGAVFVGPITAILGQIDNTTSIVLNNAVVLNSQLNIELPDAGQSLTLNGPISGAAGLFLKTGAGTLVLPNATTNTGNTFLASGTLGVGNNASISAGTGQIFTSGEGGIAAYAGGLVLPNKINAGALLHFDTRGFDLTQNGVIGNRGGFVGSVDKTGLGTLTLTKINAYTGPTTVSQGTLLLSATGRTAAASAVSVASGATFGGTGSALGAVTVANGGILSPGITGAGTLTVGNLSLANSALLNFDLAAPPTVGGGINDLIIVSGGLTLDGILNVNALAGFSAGTYRLFNYGGALTNNGLALGTTPVGYSYTIDTATAGQVRLVIASLGVGPFSFWDGANTNPTAIEGGSGTWNASNINWANAAGNANDVWDGTVANFGVTPGTVTVVGTQNFDQLNFTVDGYVVQGDGLAGSGIAGVDVATGTATIDNAISGASGLAKTGAGTLALNGANSFDGLIVTTGEVVVGTNTAAGVGGISLAGGTTLSAGVDGLSIANDITLAGSATIGTGGFLFATPGTISGAGALTKTGSGVLFLAGTNVYVGGTNVNGGTVVVYNGNSLGTGTVALADGTQLTTAGGTFTTPNDITLTGSPSLVAQLAGDLWTLSGVIADGGAAGTLVKNGPGAIILVGTNTYTGGTRINGGTLSIASDANLGAAAGGVTFGGTSTLALTAGITSARAVTLDAAGTIDTGASNSTFTGPFTGASSLTKAGSGQLTLTGTNTYGGGTNLDAGILRVAAGDNLGAGTVTAQDGTELVVGTAGSQSITVANDLVLNGTVNVGLAGTIAGSAIIDASTGLLLTDGNAVTLSGLISGSGTLATDVNSPGNLTISGANTYTGGSTFNFVAVSVGTGTSLGTGAVTLNSAGIVNLTAGALTVANDIAVPDFGWIGGPSDLTLSGAISGDGDLFKLGSDTTNLTNAANTFGGNIDVIGGNLRVDGGLTNAAVIVSLGGGTTLSGAGTIAGTVDVSGGTLSPGDSAPGTITIGNLNLTGASTLDYEFATPNVAGGATNDRAIVTGALTLDGTLNVSTPAAPLAQGVYNVATYGTLIDNTLDLGALPALAGGATASINLTDAGYVNLIVAGAGFAQYWDGDAAGNAHNDAVDGGNGTWTTVSPNWTTSNGALNANWQGFVGYFQGTAGTVAITGAQNLEGLHFLTSGYVLTDGGGGSLTLNGADFISTDGAINATINAPIHGAGSLTKQGIGTLFLGGNNDYSGGTTIENASNIAVSSSTALGTGALTFAVSGGALVAVADGLTIGNNLVLNGADVINTNANTLTLSGVISNTGSLNKVGGGTLVLGNASNSYSGGTFLNGGTVQIADDHALGDAAGALTFVAGPVSTLRTSANVTSTRLVHLNGNGVIDTQGFDDSFGGTVDGAGTLAKDGSGRLTLTGTNTYAGGTSLNAGTLRISNGSAIGSGTLTTVGGTTLTAGIANNAAITLANAIVLGDGTTTLDFVGDAISVNTTSGAVTTTGTALTLNGVISGPGGVAVTNHGRLLINGDNSYAGGTTLGNVVAYLGNGNALGTGLVTLNDYSGIRNDSGTPLTVANTVTVAGTPSPIESSITIGGSSNLTLAGALQGNGGLNKSGVDRLTLTNGDSGFSGTFAVNQGELRVDGALTSGDATVNINAGTTLSGVGSIAGTVNVANFGTIAPGDSPGVLTVGNLNLSSSSILAFELGQANVIAGPFNDQIIVTNNLTLDGTLNVTDSGAFGLGVYNLITYGGVLTNNGLAIGSLPASYTGTVQTLVAGQVNLIITAPGTLVQYWDGADGIGNGVISGGNGTWTTASTNWTGAPPSAINANWQGGVGVFTTVGGTVDLANSFSFEGLQFAVDGYTLNGAGGGLTTATSSYFSTSGGVTATINAPISGAGAIDKQGAGTLVLGGTNTYAGGTTLTGGTLGVASNAALGTGALVMAGGTTLAAGVSGLVIGNAITMAGAGTVDSGAGTFTLANTIFGPGSITKTGTGNLVLNGANLFTDLGIQTGTVTLGTNTAAGIGGISIDNGTTLAAGVSGLVVGNAVSTAGAGTIDSGAGVFTLSNTVSGPGSITKTGAGNLVLNGSNSFTDLGINSGTVTLGTNTAGGIGGISLAGGTTLAAGVSGLVVGNAISTAGAGTVDSGAGVFTLSNTVSGPGSITKTGAGNLVLNGANLFTDLGIAAGTVTLGTNTAAGIGGISIGNGTTLAAGVSGLVIGNAISTVGAGTVDSGAGVFTLANTIFGPGSITKTGTGNLVLNGANLFTDLGIQTGTVTLGTNTAAGIGGISIDNGTTLAAGVSGLVVGNAVSTAGAGTIDSGAGVFTLSNTVSGPGSITKTGAGNLVLNGSNSFTDLGINSGTVTLGTNTAGGIGGISLAGGTTLAAGVSGLVVGNAISTAGAGTVDSGAGVFTLANTIFGPGSITKTGAGNLVLNGSNLFTDLGIQTGTVTLGTSTAAGIGGISIGNGTTLAAGVSGLVIGNAISTVGAGTVDSGAGTFTLANTIFGPGSLTKTGAGNLVLNGSNLFTDLGIQAGTVTLGTNTAAGIGGISIGNGTTLAAGAAGLTIGNAVSLNGVSTIDSNAFTLTLSNTILGTGSLAKAGAGTLVLTGNSTYTGATNVNAGTLKVNGSLGATAVTVASGATLGGFGSIVGGVTIANGGTLAPGGGIGTLTVGALTLNPTSNVNYDLGAPNTIAGPFNDLTVVTGNLTLDGLLNVTNSNAFGLGIYELFSYGGALTDNGLTINSLPAAATGIIQTLIPGQVNLIVTAPGTLVQYWDGADGVGNGVISGGSGTWNAANTNWTGAPPSALNANWQGGVGVFMATPGTVNIVGLQSYQALQFAVDGYVLNGSAGNGLVANGASILFAATGATATINAPISGTGSVTKQGGGNLVLNGSNSFTDLGISGGTVTLGTNTAAGIGGISIGNGTTLAAGVSGLVISNGVSTAGAGTVDSGAGTFTLANTIFGPGSITKTGAGNLVLNGSNLFTDLGIQAGTVTLGTNTAAGIGGISIGNGTTLAAGVSGLVVGNAISTAGAGTVDSGAGTFTLANTIFGPGSITKTGTGNLVLNGSNLFTDLGIAAGTVTLGTNTAAGIGGISIGNGTTLAAGVSGLVISNGVSTAGAGTVDSGAGTFTLANTIFGPGSITKTGTGNLVLNGNNLFTDLGISAGRVTLGTNTAAGIGGISIGNGTTLAAGVSGLVIGNAISTAGAGTVDSGAGVFTLANTIFGPGSITKTGTGNLVLNGANLFTDLGISAGRVTLGTNTAAGISGISMAGGTTLAAGSAGLVIANPISTAGAGTIDTNVWTFTLNGPIAGPGSITKIGSGNLVLNGNNSFTDLGIQTGTVTLGTNTAAGIGGISMGGGTTLAAGVSGLVIGNAISTAGAGTIDSGSGVFTLSNTIFGPGSITKTGAGNLVLNGANLFTDLGIKTGTVTLGTNTAAGIGGISIGNGTTLAAGVSGLVISNGVSTAGAGTVDSGAGTFTLANTIFGPGSITKTGAGNLVINGNNLFTDLGIQAGTVTLGTNTAAGIGGISLGNGTTLAAGVSGLVIGNAISTAGAGTVDSGAGTFTLANTIFGPGSITKTGTGNLVLNGANLFTDLGIAAGTVTLGTNTAAGIGGISMAGGTTLAAGVSGLLVGNAISTAGAGTINSGSGIFTLGGPILGAGSITKTGTGNLVLNGNNSFIDLGVQSGTVTLGTNTAGGANGISLNGGTTLAAGVSGLVIANPISTVGAASVDSGAGIFTLNGPISGAGSITQIGSGNLVLNGSNSFTDLGIKSGTVTLGSNTAAGKGGISMNGGTTLAAGVPGLVVSNFISTGGVGTINSASGNFTLTSAISGPGSITKTGAGTLTLGGISSYAGPTLVSAGRLDVTGSIATSATTVQSGGTLGGTGTAGALNVLAGGTVSPGLSGAVGNLSVAGGVTFAAGSTYAADVTVAGADRITATGPASLNGTLALNVLPGAYTFSTTYTLLSSSARTGTFTTTNLGTFGILFNPTVTYDATSAFLKLAPASLAALAGTGLSPNQAAVAAAFDRATAAGFNPQAYVGLYGLGAGIGAGLTQLSGELHAAERRVALDDTRVVRETAFDRLNAGLEALTGAKEQTATTEYADAETTVWLRGAGSWGKASADGVGQRFETKQVGVLTGVDYKTGPWKVGAAFTYLHNDLEFQTIGKSKVESTGGAIYGGYRQENGFSVGVGASVAGVSAKGNRGISIPGLGQTLTSNAKGTVYQGFGEVAFDLAAAAETRIEPFARFAYAKYDARAFSEAGGVSAVSGAKQGYDQSIVSAGLRGSALFGGATLTGSVAYQHVGGDRSPVAQLTIAGLGQSADIRSVALDKDAAAIEAQASFRIGRTTTFGVGYSGVIGSNNTDHGARATLTLGF